MTLSARLRGRRLAWSRQRNVANRIPERLLERGEPGALATLTIRRVEARCREFKSRRPHHKTHTHNFVVTTNDDKTDDDDRQESGRDENGRPPFGFYSIATRTVTVMMKPTLTVRYRTKRTFPRFGPWTPRVPASEIAVDPSLCSANPLRCESRYPSTDQVES